MKKTIALILVVMLLALSTAPGFAATKFSDVGPNEWFTHYLDIAVASGYIQGSGGKFNPNGLVNSAQMVTIVARVHSDKFGFEIKESQDPDDAWFAKYFAYCEEHEVIDKNIMYYIDPQEVVQREFLAYMLYQAVGGAELEDINYITVADEDLLSTPFKPAVEKLVNAGIITGIDINYTFNPYGDVTRAQLATMLARILDTSLRVRKTT